MVTPHNGYRVGINYSSDLECTAGAAEQTLNELENKNPSFFDFGSLEI